DLGMYLSFGDWYGGGTREVNPDLALWDYANEPLLVGEVKTPWTLDLVRLMARQNTDELRFRANFGASAGMFLVLFHLAVSRKCWTREMYHRMDRVGA
ncbi:MAG: hypothetical protein Q9198_004058, partial [Flavoplaca austrocitrina]